MGRYCVKFSVRSFLFVCSLLQPPMKFDCQHDTMFVFPLRFLSSLQFLPLFPLRNVFLNPGQILDSNPWVVVNKSEASFSEDCTSLAGLVTV